MVFLKDLEEGKKYKLSPGYIYTLGLGPEINALHPPNEALQQKLDSLSNFFNELKELVPFENGQFGFRFSDPQHPDEMISFISDSFQQDELLQFEEEGVNPIGGKRKTRKHKHKNKRKSKKGKSRKH